MMTERELTETVLRVMRRQLQKKIWPSVSGLEDMDNPEDHPAIPPRHP